MNSSSHYSNFSIIPGSKKAPRPGPRIGLKMWGPSIGGSVVKIWPWPKTKVVLRNGFGHTKSSFGIFFCICLSCATRIESCSLVHLEKSYLFLLLIKDFLENVTLDQLFLNSSSNHAYLKVIYNLKNNFVFKSPFN